MKTIAFAAVAFIIVTGSAFAGSDHYGSSNWQPTVGSTDRSYTASIKRTAKNATQKAPKNSPYNPADSYGQGIWGM
ncbi:DUF680 domain-containing protein [Mesorhizobium sp. M00.F.Ca.ET.216.01.1.1]|uniref:DUF680 domain-containing protein n=1 Tax=Mesorhizobium sp. M00.F.Ca.ET.216.01.1.1 TaxID=2500528 RepID=UPI000FDB42A4|nr:DUF680 domain-containing protein [Mesorhizobium sp. M00.F.Ca.ET.216.01.1.1]TGQ33383.1 DUF680 domain-containing protein [Mesorhizobium sp. M00.F.Ca.ET.216.01.1.1]